jgi:uncharacterized membrane protein SpoIIM required for sporulation
MKQQHFEQHYAAQWQAFDTWLVALQTGKPIAEPPASFPLLYRQLCQQLSLARDRCYSPRLIDQLNQRVLQGHQALYGARGGASFTVAHFLLAELPRRVRAEWRVVLLACLLFYGSFGLMIVLLAPYPELVYSFVDATEIAEFEAMYEPSGDALGPARDAESNFLMFGFYIHHNISIAFQMLAGGLVFTLGTLFYLLFNGVYLGVVAGHLSYAGYAETFWAFVIGHGAFELTGLVFAGAIGLRLGLALLAPGRYYRVEALKQAMQAMMPLLYAVFGMLLIAAFIEAFWSASNVHPAQVKFIVGGLLWTVVVGYFVFVGR